MFLEHLEKAFESDKLRFPPSIETLRQRGQFQRYLAPVRKAESVVYAKKPFAGPRQVLDYLGRYTHRVAISNNRLLDIEDGRVRFRWKDYRNSNRHKMMTLRADEFIRRFLIHVLPDRFQRIRYYGFLSNRYRKQKLDQCRRLLGVPAGETNDAAPEQSADYRNRHERLTGTSLRQCPLCNPGRMVEVGDIPAAPPFTDTS